MQLNKILHKLLASYLFLLIIVVIISVFGFMYYTKIDKLYKLSHQVQDLQITVRDVISYDRQFLMYETINPLFYETGVSSYLYQHEKGYKRLTSEMNALQSNNAIKSFEIIDQIDSIAVGIAIYDSLYKVMVSKIKKRGFKDYGMVGLMRENVHQLEQNKMLGVSLSDILMLRRHEKDYIIRNDLVYADKLQGKIQAILSQNLPQESEILLKNYLTSFQKVVMYDQQIGMRNTAGMSKLLKIQTEDLEVTLSSILIKVDRKRQEIFADMNRNIITMIVILFIIGIVFSVLIASRLTRPLRRLTRTIDQLIDSNFDDKTSLTETNSKDEVGRLTNHFNLMIRKIQQNIKELGKKHATLEERNSLLKSTNEKLADSEQKLQQMNLIKDKFFSIISHDLRGPFNALRGFLNILNEHADGFSPAEIKNLTQSMTFSVNNLYDLTDNLLQWSLAQTKGLEIKMTKVSVYQVAEKNRLLFQQKAAGKVISLENVCPKNVFVETDKNMLLFIIRNLVSNALKFTEGGGNVKITCEVKDQQVFIKVIDSGIGISQDNIKRLFKLDDKFTTKGTQQEKGSGLGLVLCKEFLDKLNSNLHIKSEIGKGTEFMFFLPEYVSDETQHTTLGKKMSI